jgi:hypothetical protein
MYRKSGDMDRSTRMKVPQKKVVPSAFQVPPMSSEKIEQLIERVQSGKFSERELLNLYDNAEERQFSSVMEAIAIKLRADFPRAATRKFGPKPKASKRGAAGMTLVKTPGLPAAEDGPVEEQEELRPPVG